MFTWKPTPLQSCVSLRHTNRYYHQDLHYLHDPCRLTPNTSAHVTRTPTQLWLEQPVSWRTIGDLLKHRPFSGLVHSAGELLHTPWPIPTSMATALLSRCTNTLSGIWLAGALVP